jgi:energy-coupling factor transporter ATP-binding protein EcfA2
MKNDKNTLAVRGLAQIQKGSVEFGDFTLIVGPQASGKSIFLQLFKLILDRHNISSVLRTNGYDWGRDSKLFLDLYFGETMSGIWKGTTQVKFEGEVYYPDSFLPKQGVGDRSREEKLFYIPAQRVVSMHQGWPRNFGSFDIGDPYALKSFSETIRVLMEKDSTRRLAQTKVFPNPRRIKEPLRKLLDSSIFFGAAVELDRSSLKKRFVLHVADSRLPFMTWSAGQKEFMPLLLSFYHLMPSAKISLRDSIKWVVIEEPEMGLHPQAIQSVMVVLLELMARGYNVVISTHSPVLLELAWAMNYVKKFGGGPEDVFALFSLPYNQSLQRVFEKIIRDKTFKTYYFKRQEGGVRIKDISSLDAGSKDPSTANWGGLTEFASKASDVVAKMVAHEE